MGYVAEYNGSGWEYRFSGTIMEAGWGSTNPLAIEWWYLRGRCFLDDGRGSVRGKAGRGGRDRWDRC